MRWALKGDGCCYRPFLYDPAMIGGRLAANGFHRIYEACTATWVTRVYARAAEMPASGNAL